MFVLLVTLTMNRCYLEKEKKVIGIYPDPSTDLVQSGLTTDAFAPCKLRQSGYCLKIHPLEVAEALICSPLVSQPVK